MANQYEVLDFRLVPFQYHQSEINTKKFIFIQGGVRPLHIKKDLFLFLAKIRLILYYKNFFRLATPLKFYKSFFSGDYIYVAFRKSSNTKFVEPAQITHEPMYRHDVVLDNL